MKVIRVLPIALLCGCATGPVYHPLSAQGRRCASACRSQEAQCEAPCESSYECLSKCTEAEANCLNACPDLWRVSPKG